MNVAGGPNDEESTRKVVFYGEKNRPWGNLTIESTVGSWARTSVVTSKWNSKWHMKFLFSERFDLPCNSKSTSCLIACSCLFEAQQQLLTFTVVQIQNSGKFICKSFLVNNLVLVSSLNRGFVANPSHGRIFHWVVKLRFEQKLFVLEISLKICQQPFQHTQGLLVTFYQEKGKIV